MGCRRDLGHMRLPIPCLGLCSVDEMVWPRGGSNRGLCLGLGAGGPKKREVELLPCPDGAGTTTDDRLNLSVRSNTTEAHRFADVGA